MKNSDGRGFAYKIHAALVPALSFQSNPSETIRSVEEMKFWLVLVLACLLAFANAEISDDAAESTVKVEADAAIGIAEEPHVRNKRTLFLAKKAALLGGAALIGKKALVLGGAALGAKGLLYKSKYYGGYGGHGGYGYGGYGSYYGGYGHGYPVSYVKHYHYGDYPSYGYGGWY